ncbi:MAG: glycosyltransferase [Planctomycetaceae bacterium]|nr:glycosyltransferase [Planctomycetaceae bacterium]
MLRPKFLNDNCAHVSYSRLENASRIEKEAESQIRTQIVERVLLIGTAAENQSKSEEKSRGIELVLLPSVKGSVFGKWLSAVGKWPKRIVGSLAYLEFYFRVLFFLLKAKPKVITCHQLLLLPLCSVSKLLIGCKLVYSPHELELHRTGLRGLLWVASFLIEKVFIRTADRLVVVSPPIAAWYEDHYRCATAFVIPNVPYNPAKGNDVVPTTLLRSFFSIPKDDLIFLYQGIVDEFRGINELLDVFTKTTHDKHLVIMGHGPLVEKVISYSAKWPNIHFKASVPVREIVTWSSSADIGVFFSSRKISLSYRYSLPNKFYEYSIAGLFILVSNNFEVQAKIVSEEKLGSTIPADVSALATFVNTCDPVEIRSTKLQSRHYRSQQGWQNYDEMFRQIYLFSA